MDFWHFADPASLAGQVLDPVYQPGLGWLGGLLAMIGSYAMFPAIRRIHASGDRESRGWWLTGGAIATGFGFWSMHWMAMLGFHLPVPVDYELFPAVASMLPAIAASAVVIHLLSQGSPTPRRLFVSALILGLGLAGTNYIAMEAIAAPAVMVYDLPAFLRSIALSCGFSLLALYLNLLVARKFGQGLSASVVGSGVLALAGLSIHFSGMAAVAFVADTATALSAPSAPPAFLLPTIVASTLLLVGTLCLVAVMDSRRGSAMANVRASEQRLRAVLGSLQEAVIVTDEQGIISDCNPATEQVFGYAAADMIGHSLGLLLPKPHRQGILIGGVNRLGQAGGRTVHPDGGRRQDGTTFPIELTAAAMAAADVRQFSWVVRDLSARWKANQEMRQLAAAVEASQEPIVILGPDRRIEYVNPAFELTTGFARAEVVGNPPRHGACDPETYQAIWRQLEQGRPWSGSLKSYRRDGSISHEEASITGVTDPQGKVTAYVGTFRDVTARVHAEQERGRLVAALEQAADSIQILDAEGRIVYVNKAFEQQTGRRLADTFGTRSENFLELARAGSNDDERPHAGARDDGRVGAGTVRGTSKAGARGEQEFTVSPILDEHGAASGYVVMTRDVTEQKALERQLQQAQKLESIGQLAAGIAHEINTPTQYVGDNIRFLRDSFAEINGTLNRLTELAATNVPVSTDTLAAALRSADVEFLCAEIPKALEQSAEGCQRISTIVKAMKEFSHPAQDKTPVDLHRAIQSTITVASNEWKYIAEVRTNFDPALPHVTCLPGEFNQVILNMLVNAAHAIADVVGDGATGKGTITVSTRQIGEWAEIRISDTGTGITPEIRAKIFDPFFTTKQVGKGTGQGLAIAHDVIVKKHGGTLALESEVGKGSTFIVRIPISAESAIQATTGKAHPTEADAA